MGQGGWGPGGGPSERTEGACRGAGCARPLGPQSSRGGGAAEAPSCGGGRGLGSRDRPEAAFLRHLPEPPSGTGWSPRVGGLERRPHCRLSCASLLVPTPPAGLTPAASFTDHSCTTPRCFVCNLPPRGTQQPPPTPCVGWGTALVLAESGSPGGPNVQGGCSTPEGLQPSVPCRPVCRSPLPPPQPPLRSSTPQAQATLIMGIPSILGGKKTGPQP